MHPDFATILNWRLLAGSHPFPGPDGGTCINEAAIVAAGLPYRAIRSSADCPPCFSRPAAAYALGLNDAMPDEARPQLMAFVLRLSGSADTPEIEAARTRRLALESVRRILGPVRFMNIKMKYQLDGGLGHALYEIYRVAPGSSRGQSAAALSRSYYAFFRQPVPSPAAAAGLRKALMDLGVRKH